MVSRVGYLSLLHTHKHTHTLTHTQSLLAFICFNFANSLLHLIKSIADAILKTISSQCKEYFFHMITPCQSQETFWWPHEGQVPILISDTVSGE